MISCARKIVVFLCEWAGVSCLWTFGTRQQGCRYRNEVVSSFLVSQSAGLRSTPVQTLPFTQRRNYFSGAPIRLLSYRVYGWGWSASRTLLIRETFLRVILQNKETFINVQVLRVRRFKKMIFSEKRILHLDFFAAFAFFLGFVNISVDSAAFVNEEDVSGAGFKVK